MVFALAIFTTQNLAAGRNDRVVSAFAQTLIGCSVIVALTTAYFLIFSKITLMFFGYEAQLIIPIKEHLFFYSITLILVAANQSLAAVFNGSGDTVIPLAIVLFSVFFIKIPISAFEIKLYQGQSPVFGDVLSLLCMFTFSLIYFATGFYKNWTLVEAKNR